jgi:hypothetical protein
MVTLTNCNHCKSKLVIVEDKLFYSSEKSETNIYCPVCKKIIQTEQTDGWFFVQTVTEYEKDREIERKKERLPYPML